MRPKNTSVTDQILDATLSGPYTCKQFAQTEYLRKLLDSVGCCLRACASCLREIKTV